MERSPGSRKTPINLSQLLERQLNSYALAASAAGVAMLALTQPAQAKIVYTRAHEVFGRYGLHSYTLDLNHDGIGDFVLNWQGNATDLRQYLWASGNGKRNEVLGQGAGSTFRATYASALKAGTSIGTKDKFHEHGIMVRMVGGTQSDYEVSGGNWANVNNRYLGLKFWIKGKVHYAWARLSVKCQLTGITALLTGYAYETIANKPIIAGQIHGADDYGQLAPASLKMPAEKPATLGWLALGAPGLSIWKRGDRPEAAQP
jgi:hypothetical protein